VDVVDADLPGNAVNFNRDYALFTDGSAALGNLVAFYKVGVGVVLAVETGIFGDGAVQRQGCHHGEFHRLAVNHRQYPRHAHAHGAYVSIGRGAGVFGAAAAEHLALSQQLGVDFQSDNSLVIHS